MTRGVRVTHLAKGRVGDSVHHLGVVVDAVPADVVCGAHRFHLALRPRRTLRTFGDVYGPKEVDSNAVAR